VKQQQNNRKRYAKD